MCCYFLPDALCKACHTEGGLRAACCADFPGFSKNAHFGAGLELLFEVLTSLEDDARNRLPLSFFLLIQIGAYSSADSAEGCQVCAGAHRADAEAYFAIQGANEYDADEQQDRICNGAADGEHVLLRFVGLIYATRQASDADQPGNHQQEGDEQQLGVLVAAEVLFVADQRGEQRERAVRAADGCAERIRDGKKGDIQPGGEGGEDCKCRENHRGYAYGLELSRYDSLQVFAVLQVDRELLNGKLLLCCGGAGFHPVCKLLAAMRAELGFRFKLPSASGAESLPFGLGLLQRGVHSGSFRGIKLLATESGRCGCCSSVIPYHEYSMQAFG